MYDDTNFDERPLVAAWETTQACDLICFDCRACAQTLRHPLELTTEQAKCLIDEIAANEAPVFVRTGRSAQAARYLRAGAVRDRA